MSRAWIDLLAMLHHMDLDGPVTGENVAPVLKRFAIPFDERDMRIKATWHKFKQFHVYNMDGVPLK